VFNDSVASETPDRLFRLDTETGRVGPLTIPPKTILGDNSPSFSPDGRFLVYSRDINGARGEIRLRTMNDGRERVVTSLNQWDCGTSPAWTPDGAAILMSGDCEGNSLLRIYPLDGGTPSQIVPGGNSVGRLSVSANGYVAMETGGGHAQLLAFKPGSGQTPSPLDERSGLTAWCVDFAPDGALAITGRKGAARGVWVAERESAQFRKLMSLPDQACLIRWSPDGTLLSFVQARSDGFEVPIVNRSGEILKRFHFSDKDSGLIAWASDGKSIFSSRLATEGWRIWRTDLSTLKSDPVTAFGWLNPAVHGTMLFAEKADTAGIWRIDNGKPTRVTDGPIPESQYFFAISGDQIYYADKSDRKHPAISAESVYGGPKKRLMDLPFGFTGYTMGINPKFGDIVFSLSGAEDTDIALIRLVRR
jgi:Tol biopolymer transport system component